MVSLLVFIIATLAEKTKHYGRHNVIYGKA